MRSRRAAGAAAVLAAVLLALGGTLFYFHAEIADSSAFTGRLVSSLDDASVRAVVSARVVEGLVDASSGDVLTVRPLISRAVESLVGTPIFRRTAALAGEEAHRALVHGDTRVVLVVRRNAVVVLDALRSVSPAVAGRIPPDVQERIAASEAGDTQLTVGRRLLDLTSLRWLVIVAAALCLGAAGFAAGGPRRALAYVGGSVAGAGALVAIAVTIGGVLAGRSWADTDRERSAVAAVWGALLGDLRTGGLVVLAGGLVVAALALLVPGEDRATAARTTAVPTVAVWSAALVAVAVTATVAVLRAGDFPATAHASGRTPAGGCNGSVRLCDRRIDDVIFPATHNSYAAADEPGWLFANQRYGIARQLDDGIRGLLIDVHHGVRDPNGNLVRTDLRADGADRNKVARALSPEALRTADRLAGRVGAGDLVGTPGLYLCHTLCEIGAEPLGQELTVIRKFLKAQPDQVLVVIVEDYVPPAQIESAFKSSGLLPYVAELDRSRPLPTLGELIASGKRLVILAEEKGGTPAWYLPAFSFVQDTPYQAARRDELSCRRYRGDADSPLLLLNHWIARFPPRPSEQQPIAGSFLKDRVASCTRERGIAGALVAVDFYERSGVVEAARELNDQQR